MKKREHAINESLIYLTKLQSNSLIMFISERIQKYGQLIVTGTSFQYSAKITHMVVCSWSMLASVVKTKCAK